MPRDGGPTRDKLLDAALKLWSSRGLEGTTLGDINDAAGQRNSSAIQYHFDGRDGLLEAVYDRFIPRISATYEALVAEAHASKSRRATARAIIMPLGQLITGDWRDRAFVRLVAQMLPGTRLSDPFWEGLLHLDAVRRKGSSEYSEIELLLLERFPMLPPVLARMRMNACGHFVTEALADYARRWDTLGRARSDDPELFLANLVDMFVSMLSTPISAETSALLPDTRRTKPRKAGRKAAVKQPKRTRASTTG
ncbi:hypothetical protein A5621_13435 [Mycobacterium colombiense]|uniref:TetR/AcrR family transcriptional regulator n=1 Tax=Mycobacterium colombiense TaxID=339268 RepID=UPI0007FC7E38|nr:helix-turn-helix domain-containing protein [Mycobacterium colombiense]OBJ38359.1 hypothetical protein A5621_13435 [Mycobacterium colombiense]